MHDQRQLLLGRPKYCTVIWTKQGTNTLQNFGSRFPNARFGIVKTCVQPGSRHIFPSGLASHRLRKALCFGAPQRMEMKEAQDVLLRFTVSSLR